MVRDDSEFTAFAEASADRLRRVAFLMCRDWHLAQDLTQITLAKMYASWRRVARSENLLAYARKVLLRAFLDHKRRRSSTELTVETFPEGVQPQRDPVLRVTMLEALARLDPLDRAVIVLRYWEDQSVEGTAETLDVTAAVVKSRSSRALLKLRSSLDPERAALFG